MKHNKPLIQLPIAYFQGFTFKSPLNTYVRVITLRGNYIVTARTSYLIAKNYLSFLKEEKNDSGNSRSISS